MRRSDSSSLLLRRRRRTGVWIELSCKTRFFVGLAELEPAAARRATRKYSLHCYYDGAQSGVQLARQLRQDFSTNSRLRAQRHLWALAHAEGLVVDVVDGRLALRSEDSYAINEVVGN